MNLTNYRSHNLTDEFPPVFPLITRPTRITSYCATLVDKTFRNSLNLISGLFTGVSNRSRNFVILTMNKKNPQVKRTREAGHNIRFT